MHENGHDTDRNLLEEIGYEPTDVNTTKAPSGAFWFFGISTVLMVLGYIFMAAMAPNMTKTPTAESLERRRTPQEPAPLLQSDVTVKTDIRDLRRSEQAMLDGYHWTDRKNGFASVPVEAATKRVLDKGLPTRPNAGLPEDYK